MPQPMHIASRVAGACALALALLSPVQAAPVLGMSTAASATGIDLTVSVHDIADLYAYQFTLHFDPNLLTSQGGTEGAFLSSAGPTWFDAGMLDSATGSISFVFGTLLGPQAGATGSGDLVTFSFGIDRPGLASFSFSDVLFLDAGGNDIDVAATDLVTEVPEPASLWLAGVGLFALLGARAIKPKTR